ncbi:MAG: PAS domain S-box protein [Chitinispirillaceae bacterium]
MSTKNRRLKKSKKDADHPESGLSDQLSHMILEYAGEAIIVCDSEGIVVRVSRATLSFCENDPVGRRFKNVFSLDKESTGECFNIEPALEGIPVLQTEVIMEQTRCGKRHLLASASPLPFSDAENGCVVVMTDITERKEAEKERERVLRRLIHISSKAQQQAGELEAVFSSLAEPIIIFDGEGTIIRVNNAAGKLLGTDCIEQTFEQLALKNDLRLADKTKPTVDSLVTFHALKGETITGIEYSLVNASGERKTLTCSASPIRSGGKITGAVVVFHDISERRWAEDALKRSEKRFRKLSETSTIGLIINDMRGNLNYANPSVLTMLGYDREDITMGRINWAMLTPQEYNIRDYRALRELQKRGRCEPYEKELIGKDGRRIPVLIGTTVLEESEKDKKEAASFIMDLSALKQAEKDLRSIEWLLTRNLVSASSFRSKLREGILPGGNMSGEIYQSAGRDILLDIAGDYINLLGTSAAIHNRDGSYAFAVCSSDWCHLLSSLSREVENGGEGAGTEMKCCDEHCWKAPVLQAIEQGKPVDIIGRMGMSVYAVPIVLSDGEIVGALHFCYGNPPQDEASLSRIARTYDVPVKVLQKKTISHEKRPPFIIDIARSRLESSARLIAVMVERKRAKAELQRAHDEMEDRVARRTAELTLSNKRLQKEIDERLKAQEKLSQRQQALESVYGIATTYGDSLSDVQDQVVLRLAHILDIPFVATDYLLQDGTSRGVYVVNGNLNHYDSVLFEGYPLQAVYQQQMICQLQGEQLKKLTLHLPSQYKQRVKAFLGVPVRDSAGQLNGAICLLTETERYFSEYEVHLVEIYARYIGHEIRRTRLEQQLLHSQRMKLLGQIATGVAHEVRNPLNAILALSEALFDDMEDNIEYQPYVEHIRQQVTRLSSLMRDLLDLGRPQRQFDFQREALGSVVSEAVEEWEQNYKHDKQSVKIRIPPDAGHWHISIDRRRIRQVIINLLENSCNHDVSNSPVVIETVAEGNRVKIRIIDQGEGIAEEHLDQLFQPFFTTRTGGTGLGLSVVKHIIEVHGGGISIINNDPPPGTTAELWLPRVS